MINELPEMIELNDSELDAVTGGQAVGLANAAARGVGGLVGAGVAVAANVPVAVQQNNIAIGILAAQAQGQ
jgi:bacteriocin-like protein